MAEKLVMAVPKGRILSELIPLLNKVNIEPEKEFFNKDSRLLRFATNMNNLDIIRVRSSDVATFVKFRAADIGVVGSDIIAEYDSEEIYAPLNLNIGKCRMSVAATKDIAEQGNIRKWGHVRVATKYPVVTGKYFAEKGIQADCIRLNGAMELAPLLGLCGRIVDLVDTGNTLKANGLVEIEKIADVSSYFIANRSSFKMRHDEISCVLKKLQDAVK